MSTKTITLKKGITFQGRSLLKVTLRAPSLGDMMDAEADATIANPVSYRTALLARVIEQADDFTGPFTMKMLRGISPTDYNLLANALGEFDAEGEDDVGNASAC